MSGEILDRTFSADLQKSAKPWPVAVRWTESAWKMMMMIECWSYFNNANAVVDDIFVVVVDDIFVVFVVVVVVDDDDDDALFIRP